MHFMYLLTLPGSLRTCEVAENSYFLVISCDVSVMVQDRDLVSVDR